MGGGAHTLHPPSPLWGDPKVQHMELIVFLLDALGHWLRTVIIFVWIRDLTSGKWGAFIHIHKYVWFLCRLQGVGWFMAQGASRKLWAAYLQRLKHSSKNLSAGGMKYWLHQWFHSIVTGFDYISSASQCAFLHVKIVDQKMWTKGNITWPIGFYRLILEPLFFLQIQICRKLETTAIGWNRNFTL